MAKPKVKLNLRGINALMSSGTVQAEVNAQGRRRAAAAGQNFEYVEKPHRWTARGFIQPANYEGVKEQANDAVLERVLGSR
ncbi:hypothetical protein [Microbacterium telephonicum]|uniref:Uncharacterized protein n=1 Tax=Microbacterium telephonicum TaxID=1714841 RepID=A0A498C571_9MICO|nr:hypothetical protein [Microbacterium telephonicum]RLK47621.1 hypothetical protein C7474_2213 [Microbacterium telephonicum]